MCLRRLSAAPRTRAQLEETLRRAQIPDAVAADVLDRLTRAGLIDDAEFASAWVRSRHAGRGLARRALAHELRQRGVAGEQVDEAVGQLDADDERVRAAALVARRLPATRGLPHDTRLRRLTGLLARKGYSQGLAVQVVRDELARESSESSVVHRID